MRRSISQGGNSLEILKPAKPALPNVKPQSNAAAQSNSIYCSRRQKPPLNVIVNSSQISLGNMRKILSSVPPSEQNRLNGDETRTASVYNGFQL